MVYTAEIKNHHSSIHPNWPVRSTVSCACGFQEDCREEVHRITTGVWKMFLNYVHEVFFFFYQITDYCTFSTTLDKFQGIYYI